MKRTQLLLVLLTLCFVSVQAQETIQDLSKKATKGYILNAGGINGNYVVTYKIPGDKKKNEIFYETYTFDQNIKFLKNEEITEPKEGKDEHPDRTTSGFYASVGGCSSFEILSMKLKFTKNTNLETWDYQKQRYVVKKYIASEVIKPKNENTKFEGYAAFVNQDQSLFVLAGQENKGKKGNDFFILGINSVLEITSKPVDIGGSQSLVYAAQLENGDVALIFAPKKGEPDLSNYSYLRYSAKGDLLDKTSFKSPSNNLLIIDLTEKDGSVFFCGTSTKSKDAYGEVFDDYAANIINPCFKEARNKFDFNWEKKADEKMDNFHLLKFTGGKLVFASTAAISDFKGKFKTSPKDKNATPYKGSKFIVEDFTITTTGEYLIAGQLKGKANFGIGNPATTYEDIVCFHFDNQGQLKAQYGVEKMNNDKKSEIYPLKQSFIPSKDGKSYHWLILEVKGFDGYDSFVEAYVGVKSYFPRYFPRIGKLDVQATTINNFSVLGNEKYYMTQRFNPIANLKENSLVFIGSDEDYKKLWINKYVFQ